MPWETLSKLFLGIFINLLPDKTVVIAVSVWQLYQGKVEWESGCATQLADCCGNERHTFSFWRIKIETDNDTNLKCL